MAKEIGDMIKEYNDDNIFNFMLDEKSEQKLFGAQLRTAKEESREQGFQDVIEKNKLDIAFKMLEHDYPLSDISEMIGFSYDYLRSSELPII